MSVAFMMFIIELRKNGGEKNKMASNDSKMSNSARNGKRKSVADGGFRR